MLLMPSAEANLQIFIQRDPHRYLTGESVRVQFVDDNKLRLAKAFQVRRPKSGACEDVLVS